MFGLFKKKDSQNKATENNGIDFFRHNKANVLDSVLLIEWNKGGTGIEKAFLGKVVLQDNKIEFTGPKNKIINLVEISNTNNGYKVISLEANINDYENMVSLTITNDLNNDEENLNLLITFLMHNIERDEFKDFIKKYNEKYHALIRVETEAFLNKVEKLYVDLNSTDEITQLAYSLIDKCEQDVFVDPHTMFVFEVTLRSQNKRGVSLLQTAIDDELGDTDAALNFNNGYFLKFLELLMKKGSIDDTDIDVSCYATWLLLRNVASQYFHEMFQRQFTLISNHIESLTLDDCLRLYLEINTFDMRSSKMISMFTYFLIVSGKIPAGNFIKSREFVNSKILYSIRLRELEQFENNLKGVSHRNTITIDEVDLLSGKEFELFVADVFNRMGYTTQLTKNSGDQGIDVIAEKNGLKIGIQTKCYSNAVSNSAIQEVTAGLKHYKLQKGMVITNNYFTSSAAELAKSNDILLWDRDILKEKLVELFV
jgi:hypothetical protein